MIYKWTVPEWVGRKGSSIYYDFMVYVELIWQRSQLDLINVTEEIHYKAIFLKNVISGKGKF